MVVLMFFCQLWIYFTAFSNASIVEFEQVNVNWVTPRFQRSDWFVVYAFWNLNGSRCRSSCLQAF